MSFGSLSANAIRALNKGAARGGFAHDTGEGDISALSEPGPSLVVAPVDYRENRRLTERLGEIVQPGMIGG